MINAHLDVVAAQLELGDAEQREVESVDLEREELEERGVEAGDRNEAIGHGQRAEEGEADVHVVEEQPDRPVILECCERQLAGRDGVVQRGAVRVGIADEHVDVPEPDVDGLYGQVPQNRAVRGGAQGRSARVGGAARRHQGGEQREGLRHREPGADVDPVDRPLVEGEAATDVDEVADPEQDPVGGGAHDGLLEQEHDRVGVRGRGLHPVAVRVGVGVGGVAVVGEAEREVDHRRREQAWQHRPGRRHVRALVDPNLQVVGAQIQLRHPQQRDRARVTQQGEEAQQRRVQRARPQRQRRHRQRRGEQHPQRRLVQEHADRVRALELGLGQLPVRCRRLQHRQIRIRVADENVHVRETDLDRLHRQIPDQRPIRRHRQRPRIRVRRRRRQQRPQDARRLQLRQIRAHVDLTDRPLVEGEPAADVDEVADPQEDPVGGGADHRLLEQQDDGVGVRGRGLHGVAVRVAVGVGGVAVVGEAEREVDHRRREQAWQHRPGRRHVRALVDPNLQVVAAQIQLGHSQQGDRARVT